MSRLAAFGHVFALLFLLFFESTERTHLESRAVSPALQRRFGGLRLSTQILLLQGAIIVKVGKSRPTPPSTGAMAHAQGGSGNDIFVVQAGGGSAAIYNWHSGDKIRLTGR